MTRRCCTTRSPHRSAVRSPTARPSPASACRPHATSPPSCTSTPTPSCAPLRLLRDEGLLELRPGHGIRVSGTPQRGTLLAKAIELVQLSRESGYDRAELLDIIRQVP